MSVIVSVVVVTYGRQPLLVDCVDAIRRSEGVETEIIVVDNGHIGDELELIKNHANVCVIQPGINTGFAGGCNLGVSAAHGKYVALINPDAVVIPNALQRLVAPLVENDRIITSAALVMLDDPSVINSAGNRIHPLGVSWCGAFKMPIDSLTRDSQVLLATGAAMACRKSYWDELGGLQDVFFAYYEDTEFCLRSHLRGGSVLLVHDAIVMHDYKFDRNPTKMFLLDRNRMVLLGSLYSKRTIAVFLPILIFHELAVSVFALINGWGSERLRALSWILRNRRSVRTVRESLQEGRVVSDGDLLAQMELKLTPENIDLSRPAKILQYPLQVCMKAAVAVVRAMDSKPKQLSELEHN